jgi:hypothetical protein
MRWLRRSLGPPDGNNLVRKRTRQRNANIVGFDGTSGLFADECDDHKEKAPVA